MPLRSPRAGMCKCSRSEEHTSELQSLRHLVCRLLLEKKKNGSTKQSQAINKLRKSCMKDSHQRRTAALSQYNKAPHQSWSLMLNPGGSIFFLKERTTPRTNPFTLPQALPT